MKSTFDSALLSLLFALPCFAQTSTAPAPVPAPSAAAPARAARPAVNPQMDTFYKLGPDSLPMDGVPKGKFSAAKVIPSQVFPGTQHTYYVYVPAQYDPAQAAAVMIFNDGQAMMAEPGSVQAQHVLDNLIYRREIPVMLGVFINPGRRPDQPEPTPRDWGDRTTNRGAEYNPPTDHYARVIVEELMPAVKKEFNVSADPDLHGIMGASSGGIAAFSTAWFRPNDFRKVITFVGSFTNIRGGHVFPELVAASEKTAPDFPAGRAQRQPPARKFGERLVLPKRPPDAGAHGERLRGQLRVGHRQPRAETRRRDFPRDDAMVVARPAGFDRSERRDRAGFSWPSCAGHAGSVDAGINPFAFFAWMVPYFHPEYFL